jgi:PAS domain S-box-containing protein
MPEESKFNILIVDDNDASRYAKGRTLRQAGFEVKEAASGDEALRLAETERPRMALLDVNLPDMNGFEVCRHIKSNPSTSSILVLQMSASFTRDTDRARGLEGGADSYLTEPVEPEVLVATVKALLRLREAEEAVRISARHWHMTFDAISEGIALLDLQGRVLRCNQALTQILGKPAEQILGSACHELLRGWPDEPEAVPFTCLPEAGQRRSVELSRGDRWVEVALDAVVGDEGNVSGAVCILSDISDRKQAEGERLQLLGREQAARAEAETANRLKDEFLATVSHELRTPLNAMLGWARLLRTGTLDQATTDRALEAIERNAKSQSQLIEDLLDVSRIVSGKLLLDFRPLELVTIIKAAIEIVSSSAEAKSIRIESTLDPAAGPVSGDSVRLQQVVWNLLSNAVKFTPMGGRIEVRLDRVDSSARITVSDSGRGIGANFLPYVFDRFRQADGTYARGYGGLGLGLAIVRHLLEMHGGTVRADSRGEGQGATFTVELPLLVTPSWDGGFGMGTETAVTRTPNSEVLDGLRVLVVDDEADARELFTVLLQQRGARVTAVASSDEALTVLAETPPGDRPDILLADIGMPEMDGYQLIARVRALEPGQGGQIPAVALTAHAGCEDRNRSLLAGFQKHLSKPVEPAELAAVVAHLAGKAGTQGPVTGNGDF